MTFILAEDAALKSYLSGLTVSDEKSNPRSVGVWFGYPDVEIRSQSFPFITIELMDIRQSFERAHSGYYYDSDNQGTVISSTNTLYGYEYPVPYDLVYQITSYSRHPRHDRALAYHLMNKFPGFRGFLPVPNEIGTSTAYRHMFLGDFTKLDRAEGENGNKRLLRNVYTITVMSEMSPTLAYAYITTQFVSINNRGAKAPWTTSIPEDKKAV